MPPFPKPKFAYDYTLATEIKNLRQHKKKRAIPTKDSGHLLIATWNLANFGIQQRREKDHALIAEIVSWFDVIALQEVRQNLGDLKDVMTKLGKKYATVYTDTSGNDERMVYVYDAKKVSRRELVGEVATYPSDLKNIKFESVKEQFQGFDRNPNNVQLSMRSNLSQKSGSNHKVISEYPQKKYEIPVISENG